MVNKISTNFVIQEFVPRATFNTYGANSRWFISEKTVKCAEFYKSFFTSYYKKKYGNDKVKSVVIIANDWHTGGVRQFRGYRPPDCTEGSTESQHRHHNAFDCDIIIVFMDGTRKEVDYNEIHAVIKTNEAEFMANGVTTVEDVAIASTWLHTDFRWTGLDKIFIVKP